MAVLDELKTTKTKIADRLNRVRGNIDQLEQNNQTVLDNLIKLRAREKKLAEMLHRVEQAIRVVKEGENIP
jgi:DNA repair exonuclease SbcCD ATPase subunit